MINIITWSKDRACQLDLTLSSMKKYFKEWVDQEVNIIYTFSNSEYEEGYEKVKQYHPEFNWIKETNFQANTIVAINDSLNDLVAFIVDDDIFVNPFSLHDKEFDIFMKNEHILAYSCRMHPGCTHCYTQWNSETPPPTFESSVPDYLIWNWQNPQCKGDWNYPMSVASFHVFRRKDISHQINTFGFNNPNTFEGSVLASHPPLDKPFMICYKESKCICSTNNKVQNVNGNRHENSHSLEWLNDHFLEGKRLSNDVNDGIQLNTCHGGLTYEWS